MARPNVKAIGSTLRRGGSLCYARRGSMNQEALDQYLADCRHLALREIQEIIPRQERCRSALYDLMLEYPLRSSKGLRPALCIATCRALGGALELVLRSAAVVELYHNAFLIHDDVEDGSESRRHQPTLHQTHGESIAVNVGDAMLAIALQPLLDNMRWIGLGKALRILDTVARMSRESTEGQALELDWIRNRQWQLSETDYVRMVHKKTSWYSFITPVLVGGIVAGADARQLNELRKFAALLGIAFQAQDDVLNLTESAPGYGKEVAGDLWEGKHTLIVMHMMRSAAPRDRDEAIRILCKPRPSLAKAEGGGLAALVRDLARRGDITPAARLALEEALGEQPCKTAADVQFLVGLIGRHQSIHYAQAVAERYARKAEVLLSRMEWLHPSVHREFLEGLVGFVVGRDR